jgi:hypothetical protein
MTELDDDVWQAISAAVGGYTACGSRVTCDPPPLDTDRDYLVWVSPVVVDAFAKKLAELGFDAESDPSYEAPDGLGFKSFRRGDINLLVTTSDEFEQRHRAATHVCTMLNLMNKEQRIALFQAVLYGRIWKGK